MSIQPNVSIKRRKKFVSGIGILFSETLPTAWCPGSPCRERPCLGHQSQGTLTSQISTDNTRFTSVVFLILWHIFLQKRHSDAQQRRSLFWTGPRTRPRKLPGSAGINSFIQVWSQSAIVHLSFYGAGTLNFMAASQCQPKKLGSLNYARSEP